MCNEYAPIEQPGLIYKDISNFTAGMPRFHVTGRKVARDTRTVACLHMYEATSSTKGRIVEPLEYYGETKCAEWALGLLATKERTDPTLRRCFKSIYRM